MFAENIILIKHIPTVLTLSNLACGFTAIMIGDVRWSVGFLLSGILFDSLDGFAARKLNAQSDFGKQLDSLADVVSFGVAPAYLYSLYSPEPKNQIFTISCCLMMILAGTVRLAKFNVSPSKSYFMGLPIPANALFYIGVFVAIETSDAFIVGMLKNKWIYFLIPFCLSSLMISFGIRMFSTKSITKDWKDNTYHIIFAMLSLVLFFIFRLSALPYIIVIYILLSCYQTVIERQK